MSILCIRLTTGEDVIGEITTNNQNDTVTISKPAMVVIMPQGEGRFGIGLGPYLPFSKDTSFTFNKDRVMLSFEPNDDLRNEYSRLFGSGLVVATTPPLTLVK